MSDPHHVPTARDVMAQSLITFAPETNIFEAIRTLIGRQISGAPVVAEDGTLVGMLSEIDCLGLLASDEFWAHDHTSATVAEFMSTEFETVAPETDIYALAQYFRSTPVRRFPVLSDGQLLGQVSRRDVLRGIEAMAKRRKPRKHYPDYREPA